MMRTFDEVSRLAAAEVGRRLPFTAPGRGSTRYVYLHAADCRVDAVIGGTTVVTFHPDHVEVRTGGMATLTTGAAIDAALGVPSAFTTRFRVPYVFGHRMTEPTVLDYDGARLDDPWSDGAQWSPLAAPRSLDLDVVDVSPQKSPAPASPVRVTVRDWTYDGRDHTDAMRKMAAAYIGRPNARTRAVGRHFCSQTGREPYLTFLVSPEA